MCNIDRTQYRAKPEPEQIRKIQCNLETPQEIDVQDLFGVICSGGSFRAAAINGKSDSGFLSQQIFGADIDNDTSEAERLTPEQAIDRARSAGLTPNFIYPTFSDKKELRKFRVLFLIDVPIIETELRNRIADYVTDVFGTAADSKCRNPARLFFGTDKPPILTDTKKINRLEDIIALLPNVPKTEPIKTTKIRKVGTLYADTQKRTGRASNIELIQAGNVDELRKRLGYKKPKTFDNSESFLKYVYTELSIAKLLEIKTPRGFCCIFHDDRSPSANIFTDKYGMQRYMCHKGKKESEPDCIASHGLNIKQVIEILMGAKSEYRAFEFIKAIYNLEVLETEWSIEQKTNIDSIIQLMTATGGESFANNCPTAAKTTKYATLIFMQVLNIARNNIYPQKEPTEENIIFPMSIRQLARACGKSSIDKVSKYLKMLIYHRMIEIVPDEEIPNHLLVKAYTTKGENHHHTNFYRIPSWVKERLNLIDVQGQRWKKYNYRLMAISYEMFYRGDEKEKEMARILYPQTATYTTRAGETKERTTTKKSDKNTEILTLILLEQIKENRYTTESKVIEQASRKIGYRIAETQLKKSINEIMDIYGLKKIRANKAIKEQFEMCSNGYPLIIIMAD